MLPAGKAWQLRQTLGKEACNAGSCCGMTGAFLAREVEVFLGERVEEVGIRWANYNIGAKAAKGVNSAQPPCDDVTHEAMKTNSTVVGSSSTVTWA